MENRSERSGVKPWRKQIEDDQLFRWALALCPAWGVLSDGLAFALLDSLGWAVVAGLCVATLTALVVAIWREEAVHALQHLLQAFGP